MKASFARAARLTAIALVTITHTATANIAIRIAITTQASLVRFFSRIPM